MNLLISSYYLKFVHLRRFLHTQCSSVEILGSKQLRVSPSIYETKLVERNKITQSWVMILKTSNSASLPDISNLPVSNRPTRTIWSVIGHSPVVNAFSTLNEVNTPGDIGKASTKSWLSLKALKNWLEVSQTNLCSCGWLIVNTFANTQRIVTSEDTLHILPV